MKNWRQSLPEKKILLNFFATENMLNQNIFFFCKLFSTKIRGKYRFLKKTNYSSCKHGSFSFISNQVFLWGFDLLTRSQIIHQYFVSIVWWQQVLDTKQCWIASEVVVFEPTIFWNRNCKLFKRIKWSIEIFPNNIIELLP